PFLESWKIVKRMLRTLRRGTKRAAVRLRAHLGKQLALDAAEQRELALLRRNVADRLLQREHALRAFERIETQAPVDHFEHIVGVLARPDLLRRYKMILLRP